MAETSLKQMFQNMIPAGSAILQGTVTKADPLEITAENDSKLIISGNQLIVLGTSLTIPPTRTI